MEKKPETVNSGPTRGDAIREGLASDPTAAHLLEDFFGLPRGSLKPAPEMNIGVAVLYPPTEIGTAWPENQRRAFRVELPEPVTIRKGETLKAPSFADLEALFDLPTGTLAAQVTPAKDLRPSRSAWPPGLIRARQLERRDWPKEEQPDGSLADVQPGDMTEEQRAFYGYRKPTWRLDYMRNLKVGVQYRFPGTPHVYKLLSTEGRGRCVDTTTYPPREMDVAGTSRKYQSLIVEVLEKDPPQPFGDLFVMSYSGGASKEGLYGRITMSVEGKPVVYVREPIAPPKPLNDDEIDALMPEPDGSAEVDVRRVEVVPGVMGTEFETTDAWSRPLVRQTVRAAFDRLSSGDPIEAFLERSGQYLTNDASRAAAISEAVNLAFAHQKICTGCGTRRSKEDLTPIQCCPERRYRTVKEILDERAELEGLVQQMGVELTRHRHLLVFVRDAFRKGNQTTRDRAFEKIKKALK